MTSLTRLPRGNVCAAFDTHFLFCRNALSSNVADLDTLFFLPELTACAVASTSPTYFLKSLQPTQEPTLLDLDQEGAGVSKCSWGSALEGVVTTKPRPAILTSCSGRSPREPFPCLPLAVRRRVQRGWGEGVPGNSQYVPGTVPCSWREGGVALPCPELLTRKRLGMGAPRLFPLKVWRP